MDNLNEDEILDLEEDFMDTIDEFMKDNIHKMSNPTFHEDMLEEICTLYHEYWMDCKLCDDEDYEIVEEIVELMIDLYFNIHDIPLRSEPYGTLIETQSSETKKREDKEHIKKQLEHLKDIPQPKQKTQEWHDSRYNLLTASNLWKCLGSEAQRNSLIYEKCKPLDSGMESRFNNTEGTLHWGVKYEPVTLMIYKMMFATEVSEFGCIPDDEYTFIGASPDGINTDESNETLFGRMIEIKNIYNREITGIPKEEYWVQCQMQLRTCKLKQCDFVETRIKEHESEEAFYHDITSEYKSIILYFVQRTAGYNIDVSNVVPYNNAPHYIYMPLDLATDKESIDAWIIEKKNENKGHVLFKTIYWYLHEFSCVLIQRNDKWFEAVLPKIKDTWDTIVKERKEGYEHRAANKRKRSGSEGGITVIKTDSISSQQIHNMPLTNSICLIKLDAIE
jgi:hypothetical protein